MRGSSGTEPADHEQLPHEVENVAQQLDRLSDLAAILGQAPDPHDPATEPRHRLQEAADALHGWAMRAARSLTRGADAVSETSGYGLTHVRFRGDPSRVERLVRPTRGGRTGRVREGLALPERVMVLKLSRVGV